MALKTKWRLEKLSFLEQLSVNLIFFKEIKFKCSSCLSANPPKHQNPLSSFNQVWKSKVKSLRFYKFNGKCWMSVEKTLRGSNYHSHFGKLNCDLILNVFQEKKKIDKQQRQLQMSPRHCPHLVQEARDRERAGAGEYRVQNWRTQSSIVLQFTEQVTV